MGTDKSIGTNGKQIRALMAQMAALLAQGEAPAAKAKRAPKAKPAAAPAAPRPVAKDHRHTAATIIAAEVPDAKHTATGVAGSGVIVHVRCACGAQGYLELPVEDCEIACATRAWQG